MDLDLAGKIAVVTGASRGIGLATVRALRDEGAVVVAAARRPTPDLTAAATTTVATDLATADGATQLSRPRDASTGTSTCWSTTSAEALASASPRSASSTTRTGRTPSRRTS